MLNFAGGDRHVELSEDRHEGESHDVSLITGKVRAPPGTSVEPSTAVATRGDLTLATLGTSGSDFLAGRSWHGLEVQLGQHEVMSASEGLHGLPSGYQSEPS